VVTDYPAANGTPFKDAGNSIVGGAGWDAEYFNMVESNHLKTVITNYHDACALFGEVGNVVQPRKAISTVSLIGRST
jgi:hypothetical protein